MNKKRFLILLLASLLLGSLLLSACASQGNTLDGTNWQLTSYLDAKGDLTDILPGTVVTAQFQSANVSGIAGCNNYNGTYEQDGKNLTFGPQATTRKLCADPLGVMDQESAYLSALSQVQSFKQSNAKLEMQDSKGKTILVFAPAGQ
jgi:heat shock protein HslJ